MKIYTLRHGETDANKQGVSAGLLDTNLNTTGVKQALRIKRQLKGVHFDRCYASPLMRTSKTAQIVTGHLDPKANHINHQNLCHIQYDRRLVERAFGVFEGKDSQKLHSISWKDRFNSERFNMESIHSMYLRAEDFVKNELLKNNDPDATILIVSHGDFLRLIDFVLRGGTAEQLFYSFLYDNIIDEPYPNCALHYYEV